MSDPVLVALLSGGLTILGTWIAKRIDFKGLVKKEESDTWESMYRAQKDEKDELKKEYKETRGQLFTIQQELTQLKFDFGVLQKSFDKKEEGYQLQIEQLEKENEELKEENELLRNENTILKGGI